MVKIILFWASSFLTLSFIVSPQAYAAPHPKNPVTFLGTPITYSVGGSTVNIHPEANITLPTGEIVKVALSGKGTRQKWIAIVKVNAYVAIHYLDNPSLLSSQNPIDSLGKTQTRLMILHMLQNVSSEDIRAEFDDALDVNNVDLYSPEISYIREQTTYSLNAGQRAFLIGYLTPEDNKEHISIFTTEKTIEEKGTTLVSDLWRVWLGIPVDQEMLVLKKSLLSTAGKP